jgi:hypothetical protein
LAALPVPVERDVYAQWGVGFLMGLTTLTTHTLPAELSLKGVATTLQGSCASNPQQSIFSAVGGIAAKYNVGG